MFLELIDARDDKDALVITALVQVWHGYDYHDDSTIDVECIAELHRSVYDDLPPANDLDAIEQIARHLEDTKWEPHY